MLRFPLTLGMVFTHHNLRGQDQVPGRTLASLNLRSYDQVRSPAKSGTTRVARLGVTVFTDHIGYTIEVFGSTQIP